MKAMKGMKEMKAMKLGKFAAMKAMKADKGETSGASGSKWEETNSVKKQLDTELAKMKAKRENTLGKPASWHEIGEFEDKPDGEIDERPNTKQQMHAFGAKWATLDDDIKEAYNEAKQSGTGQMVKRRTIINAVVPRQNDYKAGIVVKRQTLKQALKWSKVASKTQGVKGQSRWELEGRFGVEHVKKGLMEGSVYANAEDGLFYCRRGGRSATENYGQNEDLDRRVKGSNNKLKSGSALAT